MSNDDVVIVSAFRTPIGKSSLFIGLTIIKILLTFDSFFFRFF